MIFTHLFGFLNHLLYEYLKIVYVKAKLKLNFLPQMT